MKKQGKNFKGKLTGLTATQRIMAQKEAAAELWRYQMSVAALGSQIAEQDDLIKMAIPMREAVDALCESRGKIADWTRVTKVLYALMQLRKMGVITKHSIEALNDINYMIDGALKRQAETGSNVLRPAEVTALQDLSAAWAEVIGATQISKLEEASEYANRRVLIEYRTPGAVKALAADVCLA